MNTKNKKFRPELTSAGIEASYPVTVFDEFGKTRETHITGERPLTLYIDKREIVTLMTLGKNPELLVIGYLYNQRFIKKAEDLKSVQVDWDVESAVVVTRGGISNLEKRLEKRTVTSGCGQGTVFGDMMEDLDKIKLNSPALRQSSFYRLLKISVNTMKFIKNQVLFMDVLCAKMKKLRYSLKMSEDTMQLTQLPDICFWNRLTVLISCFIQPDD